MPPIIGRRRFLQFAALSVLGPTVAPAAYTPALSGGKARFTPALNAYSFLEELNANLADSSKGIDLFGVCDFCVEQDIEAIDMTGYFFPGYPTAPSDGYISRIKRYTHDRGITISGTGIKNDFATADLTIRQDGVTLTKTWIEIAARLGAPVIRVFAGPQTRNPKDWQTAANNAPRTDVEKWMAEALHECAEYGEKFGVIVAVQNHGDFINSAAEHISLLQRVNHSWCTALVDTGKYLSDDPYADIAMMVPHAANWQIKETLGSSLKSPATDFKKLAKIIHDGGYRGFVPIETLAMGRNDYNAAQEVVTVLTAMRRAIAELK